jgi:putative sterol carrier protein
VFVIEGEAGRTLPIVMEGRARVAESVPDQPTVTLTMDVETYAAVSFGRWDPDQAVSEGRITIAGDDKLARAVVGAMGFMI